MLQFNHQIYSFGSERVNTMTNKIIVFCITLFLLLLSGCSSAASTENAVSSETLEPSESEAVQKITHQRLITYVSIDSLAQLCANYPVIVHGIVREKGETVPPGVYDDPFMSDFAYTPYTIDVIEFYKGDTGKNKYTWMWKGGETETDIYLGDDPEVEPGTEMIFFFSQKGLTSPYGIYEVVDGAVRVRTELFPDLEPEEEGSLFAEMELADFREAILDTVANE